MNNSGSTPRTPKHNVQELGRKARERLEQERSKRREIVRLDPATTALPPPPPPPSHIKKRPAAKRPRREQPPLPGEATATTLEQDAAVVEKTAIIQQQQQQQPSSSSSIVCLQGFPTQTTTAVHVRRFLSGLDAWQIYVSILKNLPNETNNNNPSKRDNHRDTTRTTTSLVCWVRLASPAVAALACQRSGEPAVGFDNDNDKNNSIAIHVHPVSVSLLEQLQKIWIEATPGTTSGCPKDRALADWRHSITTTLHPAVVALLRHDWNQWIRQQHARKKKRIIPFGIMDKQLHDDDDDDNDDSDDETVPGLHVGDLIPNETQQEVAAVRRERVQDLVDVLQYQLPWVDASICHQDPVAKLTQTAIDVLQSTVKGWKRVEWKHYRQEGW